MNKADPKPKLLTRRSVIAGIGAGATWALAPQPVLADTRARFGVAVHLEPFRNEPVFRELLIRHASLIAPMNALKWASLRHTKGEFDFGGADEIVNFAEQNGKRIHGHTLLWYGYNPVWVEQLSGERRVERELINHIETVVDRYKGRIETWDVVNEVVAHDPLDKGPWRKGIWHDYLGPRHVDIAFKTAAQVDPSARLFINDYDLEDDSPRTKARQEAILRIVQRLQDKNIPIHGVGLQAHLYAERRTGRENLVRFVERLKALGLEVAVTELDVIDWKLSADRERRDRGVADTANEFLEAITSAGTLRNITSWGLSDKYSWINETFPRKDSARARPLPFDENWQAKPLFDVIRKYTA